MANIDYPATPAVGDLYTFGGKTWRWNGRGWSAYNDTVLINYGTGAFGVTVKHNGTLTAARALTLNLNDSARALNLSGDLTVSGTASILGTNTGDQDLSNLLTKIESTFYDNGASNALNYANGRAQRWAPATGAQTLTIGNWAAAGTMSELTLEGVNLGAATITWPTIYWQLPAGGFTTSFATYLSTTGYSLQSSGVDFLSLWSRDGGTTVYGKLSR